MKNSKESVMIAWGGTCKSSDLGIVEGKAIVFGSETDHDISPFKDFFDKNTFVHPEEEFTSPLFLEHGRGYKKPIGKARVFKTDDGWDAIAQLDMSLPVVMEKFDDIKACKYGFSSGSATHVVDRIEMENGTHHITQWPFSELSLTKTPAEPKALVMNVKSLDAFYSEPDEELIDSEMEEESMEDQAPNEHEQMNEKLMSIIMALIDQLANKRVENILSPTIEEFNNILATYKGTITHSSGTESNPSLVIEDVNEGEDLSTDDELTVLKSENQELLNSKAELMSSFNEKEALLSEKMALLSETQLEIEAKTEEISKLEEALNISKTENESLIRENEKLSALVKSLRKIDFTIK